MGSGTFLGRCCAPCVAWNNILYRLLLTLFLLTLPVLMGISGTANAQSYQFNSVQVEGNQRIETATIITYLGIERGKPLSAGQLNDAYQRVLDSGVFETVELTPKGSTLLVSVTEYPTVNVISFEGNKRLKDENLSDIVESAPRRVFNASQAERDAAAIAEAYAQQGRIASRVTPRIIRRSDNRVDLVFEISEGDTIEVERVSFVGNRVYSDRRLRRVLETKQAGLLRTFIRSDTLIEDRIQFDKQVLSDFYQSRGYVDFRVNSANAELTPERDSFFLVVDIREGQQFRFGQVTTSSEYAAADPVLFQEALRIKPGVIYSPTLVDNAITRLERLAVREGIDFVRVEPRLTRNDRDLTLDIEFVLSKGPRVFVERIDIEGNTTTLDRVVRQQFKFVEGDPFNPREVRQSAERIRALGFFGTSDVDVRDGTSTDKVVVDVDVEEQPTGSLNLGGSYSINDGFGVAIGLTENNFLGRGQRLSFSIATAQESEEYVLGFSEPYLLGRDLRFDLDLGTSGATSTFATYDADSVFFQPALTFNTGESGTLKVSYNWRRNEMIVRDPIENGSVVGDEIALGKQTTSSVGLVYTWDSRIVGLNPTSGYVFEVGAEFAGLGGDTKYVRTTAKAVAQTMAFNEEITLRATLEGGAMHWQGSNASRVLDRYYLTPDIFRGFEPGGVGPRQITGTTDDALGGNLYAVARLEAEFPLGLPEELGIRGGLFYDVGNLWDLDGANLSSAGAGEIVGSGGSFRHVIGFSILWTTGFGPLRFNFTNAIKKETYDREQSFDLTLQARF
jgi:outer membrane protein insertion porin family